MRPAAPVPHVCRPTAPRTRLGRLAERIFAPVIYPLGLLGSLAMVLATRVLMPTPGTVIETTTRPGPGNLVIAPGGTLFIVGQAARGSVTEPIVARSIREARQKLDTYVSYGVLDDQLATFFAEGGARAYIARVVGATPTTGLLTLKDRAGAGGVNTMTVSANSPGAWSTRVALVVADGSIANTFRLQIYFDGTLVEDWNNLTSPADAVQRVNHTNVNPGSSYVVLADLASVTAAPSNNPVALASTALSAGTDDRNTIAAADYVTALGRFTPGLGDGVVTIPGQTAANVAAGIRAHCSANNRLGLVATASGQTKAQIMATAITLRGTGGFQEGLGLVAPWVYVPDGANGRRLISPEGYAAACRNRAHTTEGPWRAPAGDLALARTLLGVETTFSEADMVDLTMEHVIPVMDFGTAGIQLYGWRSLSTDVLNYSLLTGRDVLNRLAVAIKARTDRLVFQTIDGNHKLLRRLEAECRAEVEPMATAGGLWPAVVGGQQIDPGFVIDTGPGVNTDAQLAANVASADVSVRPAGSAETIHVTLAKVAIGTAL